MGKLLRLLVTLVAAVGLSTPLLAQGGGTIAGRVTDAATGQPMAGVQVQVQPNGARALTDAQGQYRLTGVPAGRHTVAAAFIGREGAAQQVTLAAGGTATANFSLAPTAVALEGLVVTATGQTQRRREVGASVGNVDMDRQVPLAAVTNLSQVLASRSPGVVVQQSSGTTGTSSRIRIRGANSVSLSNEPLIIVDGVRVNNSHDSYSIGVGGQNISRFNDINPEDIENIEIIKGPAASALYGTAAANGVIQITTKRGRAGKTRWTVFGETGTLVQENEFPANFAQIGRTRTGGRTTNCNIDNQARGLCTAVADSLASFSPLDTHSPFRDGVRRSVGLSAAGGSEVATYYLAGEYEGEQGVMDPNDLARVNLRANLQGQLRENLDVTLSTGFISSELGLPYNDNTAFGGVSAGLLGKAFNCTAQTPCGGDTISQGFFARNPREFFFIENRQNIQRFTGGLNANWRPLSWLSAVGQAGMDLNSRWDHQLVAPNVSTYSIGLAEGSRFSNRIGIGNYTASATVTGTFDPTTDLQSTTSIGTQYIQEIFRGTSASGRALLGGTASLDGASAGFSVGENNQEVITVGAYVQQQLAWRDRVFLSGAIRGDDNSAFGQDFGLVIYPAVNLSWVVSEESFFPGSSFVDNLRLRAAYGQSGQRPGFRQAETFFNPVAVRVGTVDVPALTVGGTGNVLLEPERSAEWEAGVEAGFLGDRLGLELNYYDRTTRSALVSQPLPPSLGASPSRFQNLGEVTNEGVEASLRARLFDTPRLQADVTLSGSTNRNRLVELGEGIEPIVFGFDNTQRHTNGFALGSYFQREILSFADKNGDGVISRVNCPGQVRVTGGPECEVELSDTAVFLGQPLPTREFALNGNVLLFGTVQLQALVNHRGGQQLYNATGSFRCAIIQNCEAIQNRNAPLAEQAKAVASLMGSQAGFIEDASFTKLREVAVSFLAPTGIRRRMGNADAVKLTFAGRNLATWTNYSGLDPEINSNATGNFTTSDFLGLPPVRTFTVRLDVSF
ncbi:MAG TPA: SusC/RagA family TonB-linked outer membrane protein [Longimicrobiaceae bacterium]|nr:SusC/RagA family TonB-linked outer membrane protein [Longimicrobiaceae bacterium]